MGKTIAAIGSYGVLALIYNVLFLTGSAVANLVQLSGQSLPPTVHVKSIGSVAELGGFVGIMGLSLFVQSVLLPIAGGHSKLHTAPRVVKRDLSVAFALAVFLYVVVGAIPALAFELGKHTLPQYHTWAHWDTTGLPQNVLLAFEDSNIGALIGRFLLVLQIGLVYPILCAVMRNQFFGGCVGSDTGSFHFALFNITIIGLTTLISAVFPEPGSVVGYVGTYTAIVYMLWLPILVHIAASKTAGRDSWLMVAFNILLGTTGTVVILLQFIARL